MTRDKKFDSILYLDNRPVKVKATIIPPDPTVGEPQDCEDFRACCHRVYCWAVKAQTQFRVQRCLATKGKDELNLYWF